MSNLPPDIPAEAVSFLQEMGYLDADRLAMGDSVPELILFTLDRKQMVVIGSREANLPTILIFGSYT